MFGTAKAGAVIIVVASLLGACSSSSSLSSLLPATVNYNDTSWCVPPSLRIVLYRTARRFGTVTVNSTHRWYLENRRVGGARHSYHRRCQAVDFAVSGNSSEVVAFLKSQSAVGGYKHYQSGHYHIDTGPRRTW